MENKYKVYFQDTHLITIEASTIKESRAKFKKHIHFSKVPKVVRVTAECECGGKFYGVTRSCRTCGVKRD